MAQVETTHRPLRKDAARNRDLLLHAARELFAERGLAASLDDIARRAGVGVGTAYRHFPDKDELATAVLEHMLEELAEQAQAALLSDDPAAALVEFLATSVLAQTRNRGLHEVVVGVRDLSALDPIHQQITDVVAELIRRAQATGQLREDICPSDIGMIAMVLCQCAEIGGAVAPQLWRRYLQMFLIALRTPGSAFCEPALSIEEFNARMHAHKQARGVRGSA